MGWLIIAGGAVIGWIIWRIDKWRLEAGYRVEPAPHIGLNAPTTIQQKVAAEADKQNKQAGEPK